MNPEAQLDLGNSHLELDDMLNGIGNDELGQMDHGMDFLSDLVFDDAFNTSPPGGNSPPCSPLNYDKGLTNSSKLNGQSAVSSQTLGFVYSALQQFIIIASTYQDHVMLVISSYKMIIISPLLIKENPQNMLFK